MMWHRANLAVLDAEFVTLAIVLPRIDTRAQYIAAKTTIGSQLAMLTQDSHLQRSEPTGQCWRSGKTATGFILLKLRRGALRHTM
jgi:AmiR/NasT family two-component response regulator